MKIFNYIHSNTYSVTFNKSDTRSTTYLYLFFWKEIQIIQSRFRLASQALNEWLPNKQSTTIGRGMMSMNPRKMPESKITPQNVDWRHKTMMISRQASWLRRWTRGEGGRGDSQAKISSNTFRPFLMLLATGKKLPLAKQRQSTTRQGIRPIIKHVFCSCFLHAIRKEWLSSTRFDQGSDRPIDQAEARILSSPPHCWTLLRKLKLWDKVITKTEVTRQMPMRSICHLHHLHPLPLHPSVEEEWCYNFLDQEK